MIVIDTIRWALACLACLLIGHADKGFYQKHPKDHDMCMGKLCRRCGSVRWAR